jgi:hypothetical protein
MFLGRFKKFGDLRAGDRRKPGEKLIDRVTRFQ